MRPCHTVDTTVLADSSSENVTLSLSLTLSHQQCIPTPLAWYAHQLPEWFQKLSVMVTYVIEIALPFLFFSPIRNLRLFAFFGQVG